LAFRVPFSQATSQSPVDHNHNHNRNHSRNRNHLLNTTAIKMAEMKASFTLLTTKDTTPDTTTDSTMDAKQPGTPKVVSPGSLLALSTGPSKVSTKDVLPIPPRNDLAVIRKETLQKVQEAKATLNTSGYVAVGTKRNERSGIVALEKQFDDLAREYNLLHETYQGTVHAYKTAVDAYEELYIACSQEVPKYHTNEKLALQKFNLIRSIIAADDERAVASLAAEFDKAALENDN
jgi:hypothetical protein